MKTRFLTVLFLVTVLVTGGAGLSSQHVTAQNNWYAEYFPNTNLAGEPALTRYEAALNFTWAESPGEGIPANNFSARFTRDEWFQGGTYRFNYRSDDGVRMWVGSKLVIDDWRDRQAAWSYVDRYIPEGVHRIRVEYYENVGGAALQINWDRLVSGAAWHANYYDNDNLAGNPVLTRQDAAIDFNWGYGSPAEGVPADNFSVRWTRTLGFEQGTYRFYSSSDDGTRIYVDGVRVLDAWEHHELPNTQYGDIQLSSGDHTLVVEYFEDGGEASAHVWWSRLGQFSGWEGRYYDNRHLRGGPALIRDDAEINFNWGDGAPVEWIPNDNFSASWTRRIDFEPGLYRFNVRVDDGVRVWLDETEILMEYWQPQDFAWHYRDWHYVEGPHTLRVEYYEEAGNARIQFWWDYAPTIAAAQAMPPSPTYGFDTAPTPPRTTPAPTVPQPRPTPVPPTRISYPGPWQGEYFAGRGLDEDAAVVRSDEAINFNWGWDAPAPGLPTNNFSVRWTGDFTFEEGRYRFTTYSDDGVRLYLDDRLLIDSWRPMRGTRVATADVTGGRHIVRVEYFEGSQAALARAYWTKIGDAAPSRPTPAPTPTPTERTTSPESMTGPWTVNYYDNANLAGDPVMTLRNQNEALDYNWGFDAPDPRLPDDTFSVAWEQTRSLAAGRYRFTTYSDDGVRLYIDGRLVIDSWRPMRGTRSATVDLESGAHSIRLEYFERTGIARVRLTWREL